MTTRQGDGTPGDRERFALKQMDVPDGCRLWMAGVDKDGYGKFWLKGKTVRAHRVAWLFEHGPIPKGMHLDHRCKVTGCTKVAHLRLVTPKENVLENSDSMQAKNAVKKVCSRGHDFDYLCKDGHRHCMTCNNMMRRIRRASGKAN